MDCALVLLNSSLEAVLINRGARKILDAVDGLIFRNRRLHASASPESARLQQVLTAAVNAGLRRAFEHAGWMTISRAGERGLQLAAAPLLSEASPFPGGAVAVVFLTDAELTPRLPSEVLQTLYGLTRTETQLALQLLAGTSLTEAADMNCVSKETVRTQISSVYQKTRTKRQSELVRLLMALSWGGPLG